MFTVAPVFHLNGFLDFSKWNHFFIFGKEKSAEKARARSFLDELKTLK